MSAWPDKFIIGLTGNIGTGKSVVRKMLEHLGAYGIDADALANRAIARGAPGYDQVLAEFGRWVLGSDLQVDRARLGRLVFSDPGALAELEAIIHPLVRQAIDILVRRSRHPVIVIEAIKLLESGLAEKSDSIWTTYAPPDQQLDRLISKRGMSRESALQRIQAQPPQDVKVAAADVVIRNDGSFDNTWTQVVAAWNRLFPETEVEAPQVAEAAGSELLVQRARPREADEIAVLINHLSGARARMTREQVMAAFGEKAYLLLRLAGRPMGVAGWKVENLVSRTDEVYVDRGLSFGDALVLIMTEVERASRELQCEASLLFLPQSYAGQDGLFKAIGYRPLEARDLGVRAWEEAAEESMPENTILLFKQLRQDRVLRPV